MKLAGQVTNGGNQTNQKLNGPSSSSDDHEDNAALEEWAATRIQNVFRKYRVTWIINMNHGWYGLHYRYIDYWIEIFYKQIVYLF